MIFPGSEWSDVYQEGTKDKTGKIRTNEENKIPRKLDNDNFEIVVDDNPIQAVNQHFELKERTKKRIKGNKKVKRWCISLNDILLQQKIFNNPIDIDSLFFLYIHYCCCSHVFFSLFVVSFKMIFDFFSLFFYNTSQTFLHDYEYLNELFFFISFHSHCLNFLRYFIL
jgi:hypothetical protein